ncbi:MAG: hypothetical protein KTR31_02495 [Myxococcales bacterium]|nr:hypothetical protein [Myxococcales bacterium]
MGLHTARRALRARPPARGRHRRSGRRGSPRDRQTQDDRFEREDQVAKGQPSTYDPDRPPRRRGGHPKHHDFVFHGWAGAPLPVSARLFRDFEFAHADRGQQNRLSGASQPNDEWAFWRRRVFPEGPSTAAHSGALHEGVPVFFLLDANGQLQAMGLAMMFRLSARTSVRQAIERVQPEVGSPHPDFAETLFGRVPDPGRGDALERREAVRDKKQYALAGRVSVAVARAEGAVRPGDRVGPLVLATPKASYYPSYVEQGLTPATGPAKDSKNAHKYTTWMERRAIPRGWKRYRPIEGHATITPPRPRTGDGSKELSLESTGTSFRPLPAGTRFQGRIRLHNVRPVELGALLWALDFGGADGTFHKLGLARPLGYGTISVRLMRGRLRDSAGASFSPDGCVDVFRAFMDQQWQALGGTGAWEGSRPIRELVALARPQPSECDRHMQINHPQHDNEFDSAKTEGLVLEPATTEGSTLPWPSDVLDERRKWGRDAPRGDRASQGRGPGAGRRSVPPSRPLALPSLPSAGDVVQVRIEKRSAKGKWRATLVDLGAMGTFTRGTEPPDLSPGSEIQATVIRAPTKSSIELEWTDTDS